MPDPRLVRRIIKLRIMRKKYFGFDLFADPAWDILLDLAAARSEFASVSVTSLCLASGVPSTTGLRWIKLLESAGLLRRKPDPTDGRRVFVELSDRGVKAMTSYFQSVGQLDKVIV